MVLSNGAVAVKAVSEKSQENGTLISEQYGVWEVLMMNEGHRERYRRLFHDAPKSFPSLYRLIQDIYSLSPVLFILFSLSQLWMGCQEAVKMHFSSQVLRMIEQCLKDGTPDYAGISYVLCCRLAITALATILSWYSDHVLQKLHRRITSHFQMRVMNAKLRHDIAQAGNPAEQTKVSAGQAWDAFQELLHFHGLALSVISQFTLIFHLSRRDSGGPLFAFICMLRPFWSTFSGKSLWNRVCVVRKNNEDHLRMEALTALTRAEYRQDIISNNLQEFIITEYQSANERLGDVSDKPIWHLFGKHETPILQTFLSLLGDLPIVYCGVLTLLSPKTTSFASIAILQESSTILVHYVNFLLNGSERFKKSLKQIHDLYEYEATQIGKSAADTNPEKNVPVEDAKVRTGQGMEFEMRDVSFTYPGSQANKEALSKINLTIKSGQFVVLVGANGSGKSTLVKLLLRLYHPSTTSTTSGDDESESQNTPGQVLIDNLPASSYSESSLRQSMAVLSQDNVIYPGFSLGENIGLGFSPLLSNTEALHVAARKAGAEEVLDRMKDGANTVLDPLPDYYEFNVKQQDKGHPLKKVLEELRRPVEVSGGEKQRIVAARTFMRFNSGNIRFLAVDEPSSALDAEVEEMLLDNLLKEREGKTIIFVTHRFGKLTKQADLIMCMKEGKIIESGKHAELMKNNGEYKKLYDIQASPFRDDAGAAVSSENGRV